MRRIAAAVLVVAALGAATVDPVGAQEEPGQAASSVDTLNPAPAVTTSDDVAAPLADMVFKPNNNITRAQAARMLYRIAGSPAPGSGCGGLTDVPTWARDGICWLVNNGYANGYPDRTFRPSNSITRAEAAFILYRIEGSPAPGEGCGGLTDVPVWAQDAVCWLVNNGYATGYPDLTFRPNYRITRAQAARMLYRIAGSPGPGSGCGGMIDVPTWARDGICWLVNNDYATGYPYDPGPTPAEERATVVSQVNGVRRMYALPSLVTHPTLTTKAQGWAEYLARIGRLQHSDLTSGVPPYWRALAENVGYGSSLQFVHNLFLGSSGHRANILGNYTHIGAGVAWSGSRVYVVHVFMRA